MSGMFEKRVYCIHEAVGAADMHESYRVTDETGRELLGEAAERSSAGISIAKAFFDKSWLPVCVEIKDAAGNRQLELSAAGWSPYAKMTVKDASGTVIGVLHEAGCSFKPRLDVTGSDGTSLGSVRGDLLGRTFGFKDASGTDIARIEHIWGGITRELLTTADDYRVDITGDLTKAPLVLAAALAIDLIWHES
ncbi:MAG TPA: phospholipid scramblase-related protein [Candidatus Ozemobacteraceae bacterium]|nr:phospholipid scramblase-related protein [Candidatus Ozemobacteraceae bacterium]